MKINFQKIKLSQNIFVLITCALCGFVLLLIALKSSGHDWFISQCQANIIYSAIWNHGELPFFSYFLNGGTYLIQDPQSFLFTPTALWVLIFGPEGGLRFAAFFFGMFGSLCMYFWLKKYLGSLPALISAVSWTFSLGIFWRIAVGNDMFLWNLAIPALLLVVDYLAARPCFKRSFLLSVLLGIFILGPTFHSIFYFGIIVGVTWVALSFTKSLKNFKHNSKFLLWIICAAVMAIIIASPKLISWSLFPMDRWAEFDGVLVFRNAMNALLNYGIATITHPLKSGASARWGIFESSVALSPIATVFAVIGLVTGWSKKNYRKLYFFCLIIISISLLLCTNLELWRFLFKLSNDSFRVAERFLILAAFGFAVLAGIGSGWIFGFFKKSSKYFAIVIIIGLFISAIWWMKKAEKNRVINKKMISLWLHPAIISKNTPEIILANFDGRPISKNKMIASNFFVVGAKMWNKDYYSYLYSRNRKNKQPIFFGKAKDRVKLSHTSVTINNLEPGEDVFMNLMPANLGEIISVLPTNATIKFVLSRYNMQVINSGTVTAKKVKICPKFPITVFIGDNNVKAPNVKIIRKDSGLLKNGKFEQKFSGWSPWQAAKNSSNLLSVITIRDVAGCRNALRIENPNAKLIGLQQLVNVSSGKVYRLSGTCRSTGTSDNKILFGGRIGFWLPPQKEKQIVWMSEHNKWWTKQLVFTNQVDGTASLYVHMGYGNVSSTGEFTNISLEEMQ